MPAAPPTTDAPNNTYYYWVAAFVIVLLALVAGCGLFFAAEGVPHSAVSTPLVPHSAVSAPLEVRGALDNDQDNDGNIDGMADPLVGLGLVFLLIPSVGGSLFLLSLYKLPMVGCDYCLTLERPG